jgi:hypothetical protein
MDQLDPQEQLESKLIRAPRRVWRAIARLAEAERRKDPRDQAAILLEQACRNVTEQVA